KTTMNEIAEDLSVSKPSLYYYFPDKSSLVFGVIDKIFSDYFELTQRELLNEVTLEARLATFIEIKHRFFQKYYMLHLSGGSPDSSLSSADLKAHFMKMKSKDLKMHTEIFDDAVKKGEIASVDTGKMAELYLESLAGITSLCIMHGNKELFPSKKELKTILEKQLNLSQIFIKGLK
ncbi:MAG: TetR/AcrR family transcriptional regulator, partial [Sphingobacteriales bacterium]